MFQSYIVCTLQKPIFLNQTDKFQNHKRNISRKQRLLNLSGTFLHHMSCTRWKWAFQSPSGKCPSRTGDIAPSTRFQNPFGTCQHRTDCKMSKQSFLIPSDTCQSCKADRTTMQSTQSQSDTFQRHSKHKKEIKRPQSRSGTCQHHTGSIDPK